MMVFHLYQHVSHEDCYPFNNIVFFVLAMIIVDLISQWSWKRSF